MTADPYMANSGGAGDPADPGSWNRYAYVGGDPINFRDPDGLFIRCPDGTHYNGSVCLINDPGPPPFNKSLPKPATGLTQIPGPPRLNPANECPPVPDLPGGIPAEAQIQRNVNQANSLFDSLLKADPNTAIPALFGWLAGKFAPGGDWDYKSKYDPRADRADYQEAMVFGNFDFGAVLESLDFSYTFTRNAAGIAQILICVKGGACGTGIPGLQYPFGDQIKDALDIKKGFDYEAAKRAGCF